MVGRYLLFGGWFLVPVGLVLDQVATHRLDAFGVEVDLVVFVCYVVFPFRLGGVGQLVDGSVTQLTLRTPATLRALAIMPWARLLVGVGDCGHDHPRLDVVEADDVAILVSNFDLSCLTFWGALRISQSWG